MSTITFLNAMLRRLVLCALVLVSVAACMGRDDAPAPRAPAPTAAITALPSTAAPTANPTAATSGTATAAATPAPTATIAATPTARPSPTSQPVSTATATTPPVTPSPTAIVLNAPMERLMRFSINTTRHPLAVCNDGSAPVFYLARGAGDGANKWLLWFKGGFSCNDAGSCKDRDDELTSTQSPAWQRSFITSNGILSGNPRANPDFNNWNRVLMVYCSSDLWSGTRAEREPSSGFYFRGYYVAVAIVDALQDAGIIGRPTMRDAAQVLVTGSSAGGVGAAQHADRIATQLSWADVRAATEANIGPLVNTTMLDAAALARQTDWNAWQPRPDDSCTAAFPAEAIRCGSVEFLLQQKQLSTPMFMRADLYDPVPLGMQNLEIRRPADRPLIQQYAGRVADILKAQNGAFGTAVGQHVMMESEEFSQAMVNGQSFAQTLGSWYFHRGAPPNVVAAPRTP